MAASPITLDITSVFNNSPGGTAPPAVLRPLNTDARVRLLCGCQDPHPEGRRRREPCGSGCRASTAAGHRACLATNPDPTSDVEVSALKVHRPGALTDFPPGRHQARHLHPRQSSVADHLCTQDLPLYGPRHRRSSAPALVDQARCALGPSRTPTVRASTSATSRQRVGDQAPLSAWETTSTSVSPVPASSSTATAAAERSPSYNIWIEHLRLHIPRAWVRIRNNTFKNLPHHEHLRRRDQHDQPVD